MSAEPQIEARETQAYAGIRVTVPMEAISAALDEAFPAVFAWLAERGITPAAAPFIRYLVIDMAADLELEVAVPVDVPITVSGRIQEGALPAGRYVVLRHVGSYDGLIDSNARLQRWASDHDLVFDTSETPRGSAWGGRVEHYLTDPSAEPDPAKWEVDVAYRLADASPGS